MLSTFKAIVYGVAVDDFPSELCPFKIVETWEYPNVPEKVRFLGMNEADIVFCLGGDGSLLGAEHLFPGVVKIPIRSEKRYFKCEKHKVINVINRVGEILERKVNVRPLSLPKIECYKKGVERVRDNLAIGVNDITIRNSDQRTALRFNVYINDVRYNIDPIVGDGIVASTPFGSSGYCRSITKALFNVGFGIAFNNTSEPIDHLVISDDCEIKVEVKRGIGEVTADNNPGSLKIEKGDVFIIKKHLDPCRVYCLDNLYCCDCKEVHTGSPAGRRHPSFRVLG